MRTKTQARRQLAGAIDARHADVGNLVAPSATLLRLIAEAPQGKLPAKRLDIFQLQHLLSEELVERSRNGLIRLTPYGRSWLQRQPDAAEAKARRDRELALERALAEDPRRLHGRVLPFFHQD